MDQRQKIARMLDAPAWAFYDRHVSDARLGAEIRHETAASLRLADRILAVAIEDSQNQIARVAEVAAAVAWQAGGAAVDVAGQVISFLAANPEYIARFMSEGTELFIDGTISPEKGCLSYTAANGSITTPRELRAHLGIADQ